MQDNIIECQNLTHYYGKRLIYENLSFQVPRGRILGLLGKNGTGKTTTINILSGYLQPYSGECRIFGENIRNMNPQTRQRMALLIEGHEQYTFMTIKEIERFYSAFFPAWNKNAYYELMHKLKVAPGQKILRMSCGQRSQVALGLILAPRPIWNWRASSAAPASKCRITRSGRLLARFGSRLSPAVYRIPERIR